MKKLFILLLTLILSLPANAFGSSFLDNQIKDVQNNTYYKSINIYKSNYADTIDISIKPIEDLKDPGLITLPAYKKKINDKDFNTKLAEDEKIYKSKVKPKLASKSSVEYYNVYRIAEKLIRANNLDYANWRISIRKTPDKVNAATMDGNFIYINTALYDSLGNNNDALAFVLAHEMSHQILGHQRRTAAAYAAFNQTDGNIFAYNRLKHNLQMMEYMADSEAIILLIKAGYSPSEAMEALTLISSLSGSVINGTHPLGENRIKSAKENLTMVNPDWIYEGRENIYNSTVLIPKKSSDRVSFIIPRAKKEKDFYIPENTVQRLTRFAYISYKKDYMVQSAKFFNKLGKLTNSYIPYLYNSYAEERLYIKTGEKKNLKRANKAIQKAYKLNPADENVTKQIADLNKLLI